MALYRNTITGEIRELDDALITAWQAAGNPKASQWEPYSPPPPEPPTPQPDWPTFKAQAIESSTLNAILLDAYAVTPVAAGALASAVIRAEQGDVSDFRASWVAICAAVPAAAAAAPGFQQVAEACHLPPSFIEALSLQ